MRQTSSIKYKRVEGNKPRIAIIASRFNEEICEGLLAGARKALGEAGLGQGDYQIFRVPGAFEIPLAAQTCAQTKKFQGVICLGAVVRGETPHFEYISRAVTDGVREVALRFGIPCSFGVITVDTLDQAIARSGNNEYNKGREAALAVLEMIDLLKNLERKA